MNDIPELFPVIQALCRVALADQNVAVKHQVQRLADALKAGGATREAQALSRLLAKVGQTAEMSPSRLRQSRSLTAIEELTRSTPIPVDRETAVPLAQVLFQDQLPPVPPLLGGELRGAVDTLLHEVLHADELADVGINPAMSCLIYGAPGTGKTKLALWMAAQLGLPAVVLKFDGLISSFLGTTSRNIGALFAFAARYRCVLILDEFDAIAKVRDDPQEVGEIKRVVNTLLQSLDGHRKAGFVIGITNHEHLLDSAVWRRFDAQLSIPRPSFNVRLEIVRFYMNPLVCDDSELRLIAWMSEGATGAEVETFVRAVKKAHALSDGDTESTNPLVILRRFATMNSGRFTPERRNVLLLDEKDLAKVLLGDPDLAFDQTNVAKIMGKHKGTVSRWMKTG